MWQQWWRHSCVALSVCAWLVILCIVGYFLTCSELILAFLKKRLWQGCAASPSLFTALSVAGWHRVLLPTPGGGADSDTRPLPHPQLFTAGHCAVWCWWVGSNLLLWLLRLWRFIAEWTGCTLVTRFLKKIFLLILMMLQLPAMVCPWWLVRCCTLLFVTVVTLLAVLMWWLVRSPHCCSLSWLLCWQFLCDDWSGAAHCYLLPWLLCFQVFPGDWQRAGQCRVSPARTWRLCHGSSCSQVSYSPPPVDCLCHGSSCS